MPINLLQLHSINSGALLHHGCISPSSHKKFIDSRSQYLLELAKHNGKVYIANPKAKAAHFIICRASLPVSLGELNLLANLVVLLIDVHLQLPLRHPSDSCNCRQYQSFKQQSVIGLRPAQGVQAPNSFINRLAGLIIHKLAPTSSVKKSRKRYFW